MTATEPMHTPELDQLEQQLNLGEWATPDELILLLQERRAFHLEDLYRPMPDGGWSASMLHVRAVRFAEVKIAEEALAALDAPFDLDTEEPE